MMISISNMAKELGPIMDVEQRSLVNSGILAGLAHPSNDRF